MTRPLRWIVATVCVASACVVMPGCSSSSAGTGDKKTDAASFKGGPMPPEAVAKMQAAMQRAHDQANQPHNGTPAQQAQAQQQGQAQGPGQAERQRAMEEARSHMQQGNAPQ